MLESELARRSVELTAAIEGQAELADRLITEFTHRYRGIAGSHPAAVHLAELQEKVKRLANLPPPADAGVEGRKGSGAGRA